VYDGPVNALDQAKQNSNGKDIRNIGGAETLQQFFRAGLVDEFVIHLTPVIIGSGIRLFENLEPRILTSEITESVCHSPLVTHLYYNVTTP